MNRSFTSTFDVFHNHTGSICRRPRRAGNYCQADGFPAALQNRLGIDGAAVPVNKIALRAQHGDFPSGVWCFRYFFMRSLRYLNWGTLFQRTGTKVPLWMLTCYRIGRSPANMCKTFLLPIAMLSMLLASCTQRDTDQAKRKLDKAKEELRQDLHKAGREIKKDGHEAAVELRREAHQAKKEMHKPDDQSGKAKDQ